MCTIECDFSAPLNVSTYEQNRKFVEDMEGWSAITDKLYVWDYTTNFGHYVSPHPNFGCLQENVQFFRDNRVVGLFEQGACQLASSWPGSPGVESLASPKARLGTQIFYRSCASELTVIRQILNCPPTIDVIPIVW